MRVAGAFHDAISKVLTLAFRFKARDADNCLIREMRRIRAFVFTVGAMVAVNYQRAENGGFQHNFAP
jgi:hypothetical protein